MYSEITKEFFYSIKSSDVECIEVVETNNYTDFIYLISGVIVLHRNNYISGQNYYIRDINA